MASVKQFIAALAFVIGMMVFAVGVMYSQTAEAKHDQPAEIYVYDGPDGTLILCEAEHGESRCLVVKPLGMLVCNMDTQKCQTPVAM